MKMYKNNKSESFEFRWAVWWSAHFCSLLLAVVYLPCPSFNHNVLTKSYLLNIIYLIFSFMPKYKFKKFNSYIKTRLWKDLSMGYCYAVPLNKKINKFYFFNWGGRFGLNQLESSNQTMTIDKFFLFSKHCHLRELEKSQ